MVQADMTNKYLRKNYVHTVLIEVQVSAYGFEEHCNQDFGTVWLIFTKGLVTMQRWVSCVMFEAGN